MTSTLRPTLRPTMRPAVRLAALALLLAGAGAWADETRAQLEQRIRLAAQLFADSPTAQRIGASGNTRALALLDEARLHHALAEDALRRGDLTAARGAVDDALRQVGQARRLVPDAGAQQAAARRRHEQMLATLERLLDAWRARTPSSDAEDGDMFWAIGLIATARGFGDAGRHVESVFTLEVAERHVLAGMSRALQGRELDYTQRATTPAQEFDFELQRHQALSDLLPLAANELKPRGDAAALMERYGETSRALRAQAQQQLQGGDVPGALSNLRSATLYLQRALQAAGVNSPPATGGLP